MWSQRARYAMRALIYLAARRDSVPVQLADLASAVSIPPKYLESILVDLRHDGLLASRRGRGGGHWLAREPGHTTLLEIVRAMDGPVALVPCASKTAYQRCGDCHDEATCAIRQVAERIRDAAVKVLAATTLAEAALREATPDRNELTSPG